MINYDFVFGHLKNPLLEIINIDELIEMEDAMEMKGCLHPKESRKYRACSLCAHRNICPSKSDCTNDNDNINEYITVNIPLKIDKKRFAQYLSSGDGIFKIQLDNIENLSENTLTELYMFWIESLILNEYKNVEEGN